MHSLPPFHLGSDCIMLLARSQIQQAENFYLCRGKRFPTVGMKQVKGEGRKSWREKRQEEYSWGIWPELPIRHGKQATALFPLAETQRGWLPPYSSGAKLVRSLWNLLLVFNILIFFCNLFIWYMIQKAQRDKQWEICLLLSSAPVAWFLFLRQPRLLLFHTFFWKYYVYIYVCTCMCVGIHMCVCICSFPLSHYESYKGTLVWSCFF